MGTVPMSIQNQGSWEQLLRGNYHKGARVLESIMQQSALAAELIADSSALASIYTAVDYSNASCLLAKVMDKYPTYGLPAFNSFCGLRGVSIKSTWALTCANSTAKSQILADGVLMNIVFNSPSLKSAFGSVAFTLDNIKRSIKGGWYTSWDIGSTVDISLSAFTMQASFAAATTTFELVGIDHDVDPNGNTLPLTLFMKNLHTATNFKMHDSNVNTFTNSYPYTQRANMKAALPSAWQAAMAPLVRKQIMSSGSGGTLTNYDLPCFLYREGEIFATRSYSVEAEFNACKRYAIYEKGLGTLPKKQTNGAGSAHAFWECSPSSGNSTYFCNVNSSGNATHADASNSNGLCFGFCLARDQS